MELASTAWGEGFVTVSSLGGRRGLGAWLGRRSDDGPERATPAPLCATRWVKIRFGLLDRALRSVQLGRRVCPLATRRASASRRVSTYTVPRLASRQDQVREDSIPQLMAL